MNKSPRGYHSPLRAARAQETRLSILQSVADWMQRNPHKEITHDGIAKLAGIERRTVFRYFPTKAALLAAFWSHINEQLSPETLPTSLHDLLIFPQITFVGFDEKEGVIRASLHSNAGRAMRLAEVKNRRSAFASALSEGMQHTDATERRHLECITHALYSAAAWETMKDYADATGKEAGAAVSWALKILTDAVRDNSH